ncbi:MAG: hypothetical protein IJV80_01530 [Clostridia bacterium]|nr:hypothetical protein [Clostridia bacterium]
MAKKQTKQTTSRKSGKLGTAFAVICISLAAVVGIGAAYNLIVPKEEKPDYATQADLLAQIETLKGEIAAGNAAIEDKIAAGDSALISQITAGDLALGEQIKDGNSSLENKISAGDAALEDKITAGDSALGSQITAGDAALEDKIESDVGALEDSIVWYQHEVRFDLWSTATETNGTSTAFGSCTITVINNNPNRYDCIDVGNGSNPFMADYTTAGSHSTSGYCMVDYRGYAGENGRYLTYMLQNTVIYNDTLTDSAYHGEHLYVFVHSIWSGSGEFEGDNVRAQLVPKVILGYNQDGTPVYNESRFILTDTEGIKTATLNDNVTRIALN